MSARATSLLAVGASVRAAAFSARRAGFNPVAIDLFADDDLVRLCRVELWDYQAETLRRLAAKLPACPWFYTGGLENYPETIEALAAERPLYGNSAATLAAVRNPWTLAETLGNHGFKTPRLSRAGPRSTHEPWLKKRERSAGGLLIEFATPQHACGPAGPPPPESQISARDRTVYFQQYVRGVSLTAVYVGGTRQTRFIGLTEQLVGTPWTGARGFRYAGSIGPIYPDEALQQEFGRLGRIISETCGVRGLFGIDTVCNDSGLWPIEVNPRYTASVEVLERAYQRATLRLHTAGCQGHVIPAWPAKPRAPRLFGKAVLYATRRVKITAAFEQLVASQKQKQKWPTHADLPAAGTEIRKDRPVTTVFAAGASRADVERQLRQRATEVFRALE